MTWLRLQQIVDAALDAPAADRADMVARLSDGDEALRTEAMRLLGACERAESFLAQPAAELGAGLLPPTESVAASAALPDRIGPYRILGEAGRGGMGTVYLAERADGQYVKRVALKVVREGADAGGILRRFIDERQILARLEHPHIARLLDGGVTPGGAPYLVMEFVEGVPIDRFCDERSLSIPARLELFLAICRAVQYAHQNLVVHRDLKPGNILVGADGEPKLLDFGIAKVVDPAFDGDPGFTRTGVRPMTPEFASPEQVRGDGVTTASDVYSLGVLLYLLLTGRHPYARERRSAHALERAVLEAEPTLPSVAIRRDGSAAAEAAARRSIAPERLSRRLRGDLDAIVLRALRKEPALRYATADQLADDVRRHLVGQPVTARRGTRAYRASRLIRRHRAGVAAGGLITLALLTGAATTAWQARVAADERDRARAEAATSARVSTFLEELFRVSDPAEGRGATVTARELLDRGAVRIGRELAAEPDVQAALMEVMGRAYGNLGEYALGEALLERAVETRRRLQGEDHPDVAATLLDLAKVRTARGDLAGAEALAREALRLAQQVDSTGAGVAAALARLGDVLHQRGELRPAESHLRQALAMRRRILADDDPQLAATLGSLAWALRSRGELAAAEPLYREALAIQRRSLGSDHPDVATTLNDLGVLLYQRNNDPEGEELVRRALEMRRRVLGNDHPDVAMSVNNLAAVLEKEGKLAEAEPLYREAVALKRASLGDEHPSVAVSMNNLALLLSNRGDHVGADSLLRQSLALRRRLLGPDHPSVATAMHNLANEAERGGDVTGAELLYRETLELRRRILGPDHPDLATTAIGLGLLLHARGSHPLAETLLRDALRIRQLQMPPGSLPIAMAESALGECLLGQGRESEAAPLIQSGYDTLLRERGSDDRSTKRAATNLRALTTDD